jgi:hypothetical protein
MAACCSPLLATASAVRTATATWLRFCPVLNGSPYFAVPGFDDPPPFASTARVKPFRTAQISIPCCIVLQVRSCPHPSFRKYSATASTTSFSVSHRFGLSVMAARITLRRQRNSAQAYSFIILGERRLRRSEFQHDLLMPIWMLLSPQFQ